MAIYKVERCPKCKYKHENPSPVADNPPCPKCATPMIVSDKFWYAFTHAGNKVRRPCSTRRDVTARELIKAQAAAYENRFDTSRKHVTWEAARKRLEEYATANLTSGSKYNYLNGIKHLAPTFAAKCLHQIKIHHIEEWRDKQLNGGADPATVAIDLSALSLMFKLQGDAVPNNPCAAVKRPKGRRRSEYLKEDKVPQLLRALEPWPDLRTGFLVGIHTGMRLSSIFRLKRSDILWDTNLIKPSTTKRNIEIATPMNSTLRVILQKHISRQPESEWVFPSPVDPSRPRSKTFYWPPFKKACQSIGMNWHRWHNATRHTFGTLYIQSGGDVVALKETFGHVSLSSTMVYVDGQERAQETMKSVESTLLKNFV